MKGFYVLFLVLCLPLTLSAQQDCCNATPTDGAPFAIPNIGGNGTPEPLSNCSCLATNEHDTWWFTFVATTSGTFEMAITPWNLGADYDFALYTGECPCGPMTQVVSCDYTGPITPPGPFVVTGISSTPQQTFGVTTTTEWQPTVNLVAGTQYWLIADNITTNGVGFSIQFAGTAQIDVPPNGGLPPAPAPLDGATTTCPGAVETYMVPNTPGYSYTWTVDPPNAAVNDFGGTNMAEVAWGFPGTYTLCVEASDGCNTSPPTCVPVIVTPLVTPPMQDSICIGDTYTAPNGQVFTAPGVYDLHFTSQQGCDSIVQLILTPRTFSINPIVEVVCPGTCVEVAGDDYCDEGTYEIVLEGANYVGCDSTIVLNLIVIGTEASFEPDTLPVLGCALDSVLLDASGSVGAGDLSFEWLDTNENVLGTDTFFTVVQGGEYILRVTAEVDSVACVDTLHFTVEEDATLPEITLASAAIDCDNPSDTIDATTNVTDPVFEWTGPNGFTSDAEDPVVTEGGMYYVTVTAPNGCFATDSLEVPADVNLPDAQATGGTVDCSNPSITLQGNSSTPGVTYSWTGPNGYTSNEQNPTVSEPGTYTLTVAAPNGCSAQDLAEVLGDNAVPDVSATGGTLTCSQPQIPLNGSSATPGVSYAWTGPNGYTSNEPSPTVDTPGEYILTVTGPNGCSASDTTQVLADQQPPDAQATGGTLTCSFPGIPLSGSSSTSGVTYSWSGPGGFSSNEQVPTVDLPGNYILTVTAPNGCQATDIAAVTIDTVAPVASATGGTLTCAQTEVFLVPQVSGGNVTFSWTGPNGFASIQPSPMVDAPGIYELVVTAPNGCTGQAFAEVLQDITPPDALAIGGTLTCDSLEVTLQGSSSTPGVTYLWQAPNGAMTTVQNPVAAMPGDFILTVTAPNGCTNTVTAVVDLDTLPPDASALGDTLTCLSNTATLQGNSATPGVAYSWSGPGGFSSNEQSPQVTQAGIYTLTVTAPNGCTTQVEATIAQDADLPDVAVNDALLDCNNPSATLQGNSNTPGVSFSWSGPNGFSSTDPVVNVSDTGSYTLTVLAPNGCSAQAVALVSGDFEEPLLNTSGATLTCAEPEQNLSVESSLPGTQFSWTGPGGFMSTLPDPLVSSAGTYEVTATAPNGCTSQAFVVVDMDTLSPDAEAFGNTLDCANTVVQIQGNSTTPGVTFSWSGPAGYTSTEQNPSDIAVAGLYTLTVTAPNGCQSSAQAVVVADFAAPDAQASGGTLTCQSGSVTLTGTSSTPGVTYSWSGPGGFTSNEQNPKVSEAGTYTLTVTAPNGCTQTATAVVDLDANVPQVAVGNGIISCAEPQDTLIAATNAPNPTFSWTGPGGFSSNQQNPVVTLPGSYTVVVTAANGCTAQATAEVVDNTAPPQIMASGGTITCTNPTVTLSASSTTPGVTYQWTTPAGTVLQEQNPEVSEAGDYHLLVTAPNGCTAEETVSVLLDADVPQVSASVSGQLTCLVQEVELSGSSSHPDVEYFWEGPSFQAFAQNVTVSVPGSYLLTVSAPNGCSASASVLVVQDTEAPEVSASVSGPITCAEPVVTLEGSSSTPGATFSWSFEGSVLSTEAVVSVSQAGTYELLVTGPNGCTAQTSVLVEQDPTVPVAEAQGGVLTCAQPSLQLVGSANLPDVSFSWTGPGGFSSDLPNPTVDLPGTYTLTVTDAQGCSATATALVEEDKVAPLATIAPPDQLTCIVESVTLDASGSDSGPGFALDWSTADGNFLSGTSGLQPVVDAPGTYQLTVTNQSNGCSSTATVAVELSDAVPNDADILAQPPTCFGERDGRIVIEEVFGGTPPYTYSLNFAPFTTNPQFLGLGGGKYELTIQDAQGCEWNTLIELQEPPELEVFLEAKGLTDNTLQLGDEVQLEALPTVFPSQLQQVIWLPEGLVPDCPLCLQPLVQPTHTTRIQVIVEDLNGCTAQDELLLVVDRSRPVFIPNVFSPDGDGINDRFYVFGGRSVVRIHALRIFDRWGEPVFEKLDMLPNDPGEGWDGTYRGQELDQGVYTWFAEIEFLDGEVELFKGDVLLIR